MVMIRGREIGHSYPPMVVAEIGINHGGDLSIAKHMVELIASSGGECVKHQTHFVEDEMVESAKSVYPPNGGGASIWDIIESNSLSFDDELLLKEFAEDCGLIYLSTPFSRRAAQFLNDIDVPAFKIGSGECSNLLLVSYIASFGKPVIMSTGMHSIDLIRQSVDIFDSHNIDLILLECTNAYPTPPTEISLRAISELKQEFGKPVGYSDHSIGPTMALAACALGACIIERHFTDSRYRSGPDISCSMDPAELIFLVDRCAEIYVATNQPKGRTVSEEAVYNFARSSLIAGKDIPKGKILTVGDLWAKRPGDGFYSGADARLVIGAETLQSIAKDEKIHPSMLKMQNLAR